MLFVDNLGHPGDAIRALAGYCQIFVICRKKESPTSGSAS